MKLAAILQARTFAFIEIADLDPKGRAFFPDLITEIVQRYKFQGAPKATDEPDTQKGLVFQLGKFKDVVVDSLKIFESFIVAETHSNTTDSQQVIQDMLEWGKHKFELTYTPEMITQWAYVSDLTFFSDVPVLGENNPLARLAQKTTQEISALWKDEIVYEPSTVTVFHDPLKRKTTLAPFTIQRRAEILFSENKYFSESPLPTDTHIRLLEEYESDVLNQLMADK